MVFKLTLSLLTLATLSILGVSSPLQSGLPLGLHKRQETTSGSSSDTSTAISSTASSTSSSAAAPTATPSGSNVDQATAQIIAGLRAASDGVREVHGVAATTNNSAVLALSNIASAELVLASQGMQSIYANILNGSDPNAGGANPQGQLGAALISLNGTTLAFPVAVANPTPELASAINAAQQGTALALAGSVQLALAEGLSGIIGVGSTFSSALPSVTSSATSASAATASTTETSSSSSTASSPSSATSATDSSASATSSA